LDKPPEGTTPHALLLATVAAESDPALRQQPPPATDTHEAIPRPERILRAITFGSDLSDGERTHLRELITEFHHVWAESLDDVAITDCGMHRLVVDPTIKLPTKPSMRTLTPPMMASLHKQVDRLLHAGIIEQIAPEDVKCCSTIVMAPKKLDSFGTDKDALRAMVQAALHEPPSADTPNVTT